MRAALLVPTLAAFLLAVACVQGEGGPTQDIVASIPWGDQERAEYVIVDRGSREERARGSLSVIRQGNEFELHLRFDDEHAGTSDESVVLVDAETLKPSFVRREFIGEEASTVEGAYDPAEGIVIISEIMEDGETRDVPLRLKENYYDNDSSLFLWRTIPFEKGYEASYHTVVTGGNTQRRVTLEVLGPEEITVPAGTFQTWRVEIRTAARSQIAWFADTPEHVLVQYDNSEGQLFQLTGVSTE